MTKVAINCAVGGFWPSATALQRLDELGSPHLDKWEGDDYPIDLYPDEYRRDGKVFTYGHSKEARTCPILLQVVSELGGDAASKWGSIKIIEIPDDLDWYIADAEDGREWVAEAHRTWS